MDQDTIHRLIAELRSSDGPTRQNARAALVKHGQAAVEPLCALLGDHNSHVRWEAAKALGELGDRTAAPAMVKALEDQDFGVRWLAAEGLVGLRRSALPALFRALVQRADSPRLREGAHHVLRALADLGYRQETAGVLTALAGVEPAATVPTAAQRALNELTTG